MLTNSCFSVSGGLYKGQVKRLDWHQHHAVTLVLAQATPFFYQLNKEPWKTSRAILLQKDVSYQLLAKNQEPILFIHFSPYHLAGCLLTTGAAYKEIDFQQTIAIQQEACFYVQQKILDTSSLENWLISVAEQLTTNILPCPFVITDQRVQAVLAIFQQQSITEWNLSNRAKNVFLSNSRLRHLIKEKTGSSFKRLAQHYKLLAALAGLENAPNLYTAAWQGNFSSAAHFAQTFEAAFGIPPSKVVSSSRTTKSSPVCWCRTPTCSFSSMPACSGTTT